MYPYQGELTEDDYVTIVRLHRQLFPGVRTIAEWSLWFGLAFLVMAGWAYLGVRDNPWEALFWVILATPCLLFGWARRPDARKTWRTSPEVRGPYSGRVTEQGLETRLSGTDARLPWSALGLRAATPNAMVLLAGRAVIPLVRGFFGSEHDWTAARSLIERNVPGPGNQLREGGRTLRSTVLLWLVLLMFLFLTWHWAKGRKTRAPGAGQQSGTVRPGGSGIRVSSVPL